VHAADLAGLAGDRDVEADHDGLAPGRAQVPGEPGLVVVRVDRAAERETKSGNCCCTAPMSPSISARPRASASGSV
jgi:hypothetical protein